MNKFGYGILGILAVGGVVFTTIGIANSDDIKTVEDVATAMTDEQLVMKTKEAVQSSLADLSEEKVTLVWTDFVDQGITGLSDLAIARKNGVSMSQAKLIKKKMVDEKVKREKEKEDKDK